MIRPKPKPAVPLFNASECLRFSLHCSYQGFQQMRDKMLASMGPEHFPDYYTIGSKYALSDVSVSHCLWMET